MPSFFVKALAIVTLLSSNVSSFSPTTIPIGQRYGTTTSLSVASTDRDFYEILGITPYTSSKEIKQAFRKLAKLYHPDSNKDSASKDRFYELYKAYAVLKDPEMRNVYNMYGEEGLIELGEQRRKETEEEEEEEENRYDRYCNEAQTFQKGLGQDQVMGDFVIGGVFQPINQPKFGDHINQHPNSCSPAFSKFFDA